MERIKFIISNISFHVTIFVVTCKKKLWWSFFVIVICEIFVYSERSEEETGFNALTWTPFTSI